MTVEKDFTDLNPSFKVEQCNFCKTREAKHIFSIDFYNKTYKRYYDGFLCYDQECKVQILTKLLNTQDIKRFEHIGSNVNFLSVKYNKSIDDVKLSKSKGFRTCDFKTSLDGFINKYGEVEGTKRYNNRNKKISKANTKLWFLEKYGENGLSKWEEFRRKKVNKLGKTISKKSQFIKSLLDTIGVNYIEEYKYDNIKHRNGSLDFYLPDYNIIIEFYGDYWHCNPNIYEHDYYHKILKLYAYEIWERDSNRINFIFKTTFNSTVTILIIWESTIMTAEFLYCKIQEFKNKNTIIEL